MATQTVAQVETELKDRLAIFEELRKHLGVNSVSPLLNYVTREATALADAQGDNTVQSNRGLKAYRALLAQAINNEFLAGDIVDPILRNLALAMGDVPEKDGPGILRRFYLYCIDNGKTVKGRNITFGSISAGSNLGSGTINRLTVDAYGYNLEACHMETKKAACLFDETTGAEQGEEIFRVRGETAQVDQLVIDGSDWLQDIAALSSRKSILTNASFSQYAGALTLPTEISGWTPGSGASTFTNLDIDETDTYRPAGGTSDPTPRSLKFTASEYVYQALETNGVKLDPDTPIYGQLAYNRSVGTALGYLYFTIGNNTVSVNLSTASAGWQILRFPLTKMCYPRNFANLDSPIVKIQAVLTSGSVLVDDVCIAPFVPIDGTWVQIVGGATPFVGANRDSFSWVDALAGSDSIIQKWLWILYGIHLPYKTDGTQTIADPTV